MNWILISTLAALQATSMVYPNEQICHTALKQVRTVDPKAICIPQGVDYRNQRRIDGMKEFLTLFGEHVDTLSSHSNGH